MSPKMRERIQIALTRLKIKRFPDDVERFLDSIGNLRLPETLVADEAQVSLFEHRVFSRVAINPKYHPKEIIRGRVYEIRNS